MTRNELCFRIQECGYTHFITSPRPRDGINQFDYYWKKFPGKIRIIAVEECLSFIYDEYHPEWIPRRMSGSISMQETLAFLDGSGILDLERLWSQYYDSAFYRRYKCGPFPNTEDLPYSS